MTKGKKIRYVILCLCAVVLAVSFPSIVSARDDTKPQPGPDPSLLIQDTVTIDDKAESFRYIFVKERRFRVSETAVILDYNGKKMTLMDLPIPVRAKISFRLFGDNRHPIINKIQIW
jgi:hypothetical protein